MKSEYITWAEKELYIENNHDLQPDDAAGMGWDACKETVLKILDDYCNIEGTKYIREKVEKL